MEISELCATDWNSWPDSAQFVEMLRDHGVNICDQTTPIARGTPVYVEAHADVMDVQRLMAQQHVRLLFVLDADKVIGVVDILNLIRRSDLLVHEHEDQDRTAAERTAG